MDRGQWLQDQKAKSEEGHDIVMDVQIAEQLTRLLGSVYRITRAGNSVIFHPPGWDSVIYNWGTGQSTKMNEEKGAYNVGLWVNVPKKKAKQQDSQTSQSRASGFTRQAP